MSSDPGINHTMKYSSDVTNTLQVLVGGASNEVHVSIDVGNSTKAMRRGLPRTMTIKKHYVTSYGGCWLVHKIW